MALQTKTYSTGSFNRYDASNGYILDLILTEESVDVVANTSQISYKLQLRSGSSNRFNWELSSKLLLNGKEVATKTEEKYLDYNSTWVLLSGKTTVQHADNGSLTMAYSATITPWNGGNTYTPPALTVSGSIQLTNIPRSSTVAATSAYIGDAATVAVNRKSTDFTHSIRYQFGNISGYIADSTGTHSDQEQKITVTTIVFPIPESFYEQIPDAPSGVCTITCTTYSGNTQIGNPQTATFTITADPARCGPIVSATAKDINQKTLSLTGNSSIFVQGRSNAECSVAAQARYSSRIVAVYVGGVKIQNNPHTIESVSTADITIRAEDSRGYEAQYTIPGLTLISYIPLSFYAEASRTDPTSGNGVLKVVGKWYAGSFGTVENAIAARFQIDGGSWIEFTPNAAGSDMAAQIDLNGLDYRESHSIEVKMSDCLDTVTKTVSVSKGIPVFDWGENDFCFHVPVIFTATDGARFSLDLVDNQLQIRRV